MQAIVLMILGGVTTEARADGCLTYTTEPEPEPDARLAFDSLPVDGAVVLIDPLPVDDGAPVLGSIVPDEEIILVGRTHAAVRVLRPGQDLAPGYTQVSLGEHVYGAVEVVDERSTETPVFDLRPPRVGEVVDAEESGTSGCPGDPPLPEGRSITFDPDMVSIPDGATPVVLLYQLDAPDAPLPDDPSWGVETWLVHVNGVFEIWDPRDRPVGPCFAGRWVGQTGDLGPLSEVQCVDPVDPVGCGCASGAQPGALGLLVILLARRRLR